MVPQILKPKYKVNDCSTAFPRLHWLSQLWERICPGGIGRSVGRPSPLSYHCELLELINLLARPKAHFQMRARTKRSMMMNQYQGGTRFQKLTSKSETAWRNTELFFQNSTSLPQRYVYVSSLLKDCSALINFRRTHHGSSHPLHHWNAPPQQISTSYWSRQTSSHMIWVSRTCSTAACLRHHHPRTIHLGQSTIQNLSCASGILWIRVGNCAVL